MAAGIIDIKINNQKASFLRPVLAGWFKALEASTWPNTDDAAYAYNERGNVSLLAGGAWLKGWNCLEEYRNPKKRAKANSAKSKKLPATKKRTGRVDLYIAKGPHEAVIEAKQKYVNAAADDKSLGGDIRKYMRWAVQEAGCETYIQLKIGCCFFIPRFSFSNFREDDKWDAEKHIREHKDKYLRLGHSVDLWAWYFNKRDYEKEWGEKSYYPGIVLGMKAVRW